MRRFLATAAAVLSFSAVAITPVSASPALPTGINNPFYSVPSFSPKAALGTVLKYQPQAVAGLVDGHAYQVMYITENYLHKRVPATGFIVVPTSTAPKAGFPVLDWNHGTNGMTSICAPSLHIATNEIPMYAMNAIMAKGWEVTAADYQGEGTAGLMPYLAGISAAQDSINIVRAAHNAKLMSGKAALPFHASTTYVDWGHSEGGQTAMYVAKIGHSYAKDLTLKGVAAGAPPSQFRYIYSVLKTSYYGYYLLMAAAGLNAWYGNTLAPLSQILTPLSTAMIPDLSTGCSSVIAGDVKPYIDTNTFSQLTQGDPYTNATWVKILNANDPGMIFNLAAPLLIYQGGIDEQIPVASTGLLNQGLCGLPTTVRGSVQRWIYAGQSHSGVISKSYVDMLNWLTYQFANNPMAASHYVPVGRDGVAPSTTIMDTAGYPELQSC